MIEAQDIWTSTVAQGGVLAPPALLDRLRFRAAVVDSRQAQPGSLFVALPGEHADGHAFVQDAFARGASGALVRSAWAAEHAGRLGARIAGAGALPDDTRPLLFGADDPLHALQRLSATHRRRMPAEVVGITGSVGKTGTKEVLASLLRQRLRTLHSGRSFNNEIGVPLTLLALEPAHQVAVIEMGTYGPGEIALLCELALPRWGIVTNVGASHLERMGTPENIALAKSELPQALPPDGAAILNADDARVRAMARRTEARVLFYGLGADAQLRASDVRGRGLDGIDFLVHWAGEARRLQTPLLGRHAVYLVLPAIAAGLLLGLDWDDIAAGLADRHAQPRIVAQPGVGGATILDDSYNASPASCKAALELLADVPGRRIAVFGDMAELGPIEEAGHREVGRAAAEVVDRLVVVGPRARWIGDEARAARPALRVDHVAANAEAATLLRPVLRPGDIVLVKGARVARTEEIVAALRDTGETR